MRTYVTSQGTTALLKDGSVNMEATEPSAVDPIIDAAKPLYEPTEQRLVITSAADGVHSKGSLHYPENGSEGGQALDLRIWNLPDPQRTANELQRELGADYDVVLESDHIHVEMDMQ